MLVSKIDFAEKNNYLNERFAKAFEFIRQVKPDEIQDNAVTIVEGEVIANFQEYTTLDENTLDFETHDHFYDIHYIVSGEEIICHTHRDNLVPKGEYDAKADISFYKEPEPGTHSRILLKAGDFVVVAPEDAHKPRCKAGTANAVKKIVLKVKVG